MYEIILNFRDAIVRITHPCHSFFQLESLMWSS